METKSDKVRRLVQEGELKQALNIARTFKLGFTKTQRDTLNRGYECLVNPHFYKSLGYDLDACTAEAYQLVESVYKMEEVC